jgi:hypothetical protein
MVSMRPPARASWITLLDAAIILSASAAVVILLGGRARIDVAGTLVSLRGVANPALMAAGCLALRMAIGWRVRPLPAIPSFDSARIEAERQRLAHGATPSRRVWICAALTLAGSLIWIAPHIWQLRSVPDLGDPLYSAWSIARLIHQLATDSRHLFDGNIFYPLPGTLTYSDMRFLEAFVGAPFLLAGVDPLLVANGLTLIAFPARGLATFYAAWRLTDEPRAALVAGLVAAWHPFHAEHYSHLELQWVMFVPLAVISGLRMLAAPGWRRGLFFGLAVGAQWLASMYIGAMLMSFLVPFLSVVAIAWRVRPTRQLLAAALGAGLVLGPALAILGYPYMKSRAAHGERGLQEVWDGSARPSDYGATHIRLATYARHTRFGNRGERELFPGTSTLALAAAGMMPPLTGATIAAIVAGAVTFDWSLGLNGLTYDDLYKRSALHRGMRVPARFSIVLGSVLALLGAFGARRLVRLGRTPRAQALVCGALAVAVVVDLRLDPRIRPYTAPIPSIYARVTPEMVLAELPADHQVDYMYFSTAHWARLLGGYSGYPGYSDALLAGWNVFPSEAALDHFRRAGATHLTYNCALEQRKNRCAVVFESLDGSPALELIASERWEGAEVRLYRFK